MDTQDRRLDRLLQSWRVGVATDAAAVDRMVRMARMKAVQLREMAEIKGLRGLLAYAFGLTSPKRAAWSMLATAMAALAIGIVIGANDIVPASDDKAFLVDFDTVIGHGAVTVPQEVAL